MADIGIMVAIVSLAAVVIVAIHHKWEDAVIVFGLALLVSTCDYIDARTEQPTAQEAVDGE